MHGIVQFLTTVLGAILFGGVGMVAGAQIGYAVEAHQCDATSWWCGLGGFVTGGLVGEALGVAVGAHLGNQRRGSLVLDVLTSFTTAAIGTVVFAALVPANVSLRLVAAGLAQLGATLAAELGSGRPHGPVSLAGTISRGVVLLLALLAVPTGLAAGQATREPGRQISVSVAPAESVAVEIRGTGAPVVLLPGLFGSAYGYRPVTAMLDTMRYQSIVIEPLGIGSSSRPATADYSLAAQAGRAAATLDTLGVGRAVFVAHAVGSSIALRVAYRRPDLVRGIVSIEGGPTEAATTTSFRRWIKIVPLAQRAFDTRRFMLSLIYSEMKKVSADDSWVTPAVVQGYTEGLTADYDATLRAYQGMAKAAEPERLAEKLPEVRCPVMLLIGDVRHGSHPPPEEIATLVGQLRSFSVDTIAKAGFFIQEERPSAVVAAVEQLYGGPACDPS